MANSTITAYRSAHAATTPVAVSALLPLDVSGNSKVASLAELHSAADAPWAHIKDYGAVGNGIADDTAAIAAAIAAVTAGGTIYVPPGTFLTDTITGLHYNHRLLGAGIASVLKSRTGTTVIEVTGAAAKNLKIEDLCIDGNTGTGHGIYIHDLGLMTGDTGGTEAAWHIRLRGLYIQNCGVNGIRVGTSSYGEGNNIFSSIFEDIHIRDCADDLFMIYSCGPSMTFLNCYGERVAASKYLFHCINGRATFIGCNGQDNSASTGGGWAKFGDGAGGTNTHAFFATLIGCNIENANGTMVDVTYGSSIWLQRCSFLCTAPDANLIALKLDLCNGTHYLDADTTFAVSGGTWKNGRYLHLVVPGINLQNTGKEFLAYDDTNGRDVTICNLQYSANGYFAVGNLTAQSIIYMQSLESGIGRLGTTTNHPLEFVTNNTLRAHWAADGKLVFGNTTGNYATVEVYNNDAAGFRVCGDTEAYAIFVDNATGRVSIGKALAGMTANVKLDIGSTTMASRPWPQMTTTQRDNISGPAEGMVVYNTTTHKVNIRGASAWEAVTSV
jgi:hypothetical protein